MPSPTSEPLAAELLSAGRAPRSTAAGTRADRRTMVFAGASFVTVLALGAVALLLFQGHGSNGSGVAAGTSSTAVAAPPVVGADPPQPSASVTLVTLPPAGAAPMAANDPVGYLEQVRAQIGALVAQGPTTLNATTAGDLQNSIIDIENSVISAKRNGGAAHLQEIRNKIAQFDGRLDGLVGKQRISRAAASELTVEVQQVSDTVTD